MRKLLIFILFPVALMADDVTITADDIIDACGYIWAAQTNYGTETYMKCGGTDEPSYYAYVRFDVSGIGEVESIDSVELHLFRYGPDLAIEIFLSPITTEWLEDEVCWDSAQVDPDGVDWTNGGDFSLCSEEWCDTFNIKGAAEWTEHVYSRKGASSNLASIFKDWCNGDKDNYGFIVHSSYAANEATLHSTENETEAERPWVYIEYTVGGEEEEPSSRRRRIILNQ